MHMLVPASTQPFQPVLGVMRTADAGGVRSFAGNKWMGNLCMVNGKIALRKEARFGPSS